MNNEGIENLKIPPYNLEAEEAVLGAMLIDENCVFRGQEFLIPEHFHKQSHHHIFNIILILARNSEPVDTITVTDKLRAESLLDKAGGIAYLTSLVNKVPSAANFEQYARIVYEKAVMRALITAGTKIVELGFEQGDLDDALNTAEREVYKVSQQQISRDFQSMDVLIKDTFDYIEKLAEQGGTVLGVPAGFKDLDVLTSGFQPSDLVILAARPSMGKTAFVLNVASHVAIKAKMPVAFFSLEMSNSQLAMRLLCTEAKISSQNIRQGRIHSSDWGKISMACGLLSKAPIYIDDTPGITFAELRSKARKLNAEVDIKMIVIDYLQLMSGPANGSESRQQEVSEISRNLKGLARELKLPVIALSQLSRAVESRHDKRPMLSDLRESGAIEQDADIVMFLYRDEYYTKDDCECPGETEVIIAKQRNGPIGTVKLGFLKDETRFTDLSYDAEY